MENPMEKWMMTKVITPILGHLHMTMGTSPCFVGTSTRNCNFHVELPEGILENPIKIDDLAAPPF